MSDGAKSTEGARVEKYSAEQVQQSRELLGGAEPTSADLRAHHAAPADGVLDLTDGSAGDQEGDA